MKAAALVVLLLLPALSGTPEQRELVVTTASDAVETPDGLSLREAIEATNNDPGTYTIRFAPALRGRTITLRDDLPPLTGGGVTIEGAGVTLRGSNKETWCECGLQIASSRNRLRGLTVEQVGIGVLIGPYWNHLLGGSLPTREVLADNVVNEFVMRRVRDGIMIWSVFSPHCGAPKRARCWSYTTWRNTTISGNTIETGDTGIAAKLNNAGDRIEHATVTGNTIRIKGHNAGIQFETLGDSVRARISDVLIARNTVEGSVDIGITVLSGGIRGQRGTVERVRILDNRVHLTGSVRSYCCGGIVVQAGSDDASFAAMVRPPRYLDDNLVRDVLVRGNSVSGTLDTGVSVIAGTGAGGRRNRVTDVRIERNTIRTSKPGMGVGISLGGGTPFKRRFATGNRVTGISIDGNQIATGTGPEPENAGGGQGAGGVVISAGGNFSRANAIRDVRITRNTIATAYVGIRLVGGVWPTARGNSVACVRVVGNRITGARSAVAVVANHRGASRNRAMLGGC